MFFNFDVVLNKTKNSPNSEIRNIRQMFDISDNAALKIIRKLIDLEVIKRE